MTALIITGIIILDQITKYMVRNNMQIGESLPVIHDVFYITYVQNRGAAFSILQNQHFFTIFLPIIAMGICVYFLFKVRDKYNKLLTYAVILVLAGGLGNLTDRIIFGFVTDMFNFRVFPVFNVADIAVTCGCVLGLIYVLFFDDDGKENKVNTEGTNIDE